MIRGVLISICFLLSGATSLVLEIVWAKKLSYVLGNSLYGSSTVVAAFMAGLALGAYLSRLRTFRAVSPLKLYAGLQLLIAVGGFISIPAVDKLEPLFALIYQSLSQTHSLFLLIRFSAVFVLVMIPVTLMGMTLPVVVEAIRDSQERTSRLGGMLYGLNTLGAFTGTLAAGYWLIPAFGLLTSTRLIAGVDFALAVLLFGMARRAWPSVPVPAHSTRQPVAMLDAVILVSGLTAIALEVVWFRFLVNVFGASTYALTNMLATYLLGIAVGSLVGVRLLRRGSDSHRILVYLQLSVCFVTLIGIAIYNIVPDVYIRLYWWLGGNVRFLNLFIAQFSVAALIVLPPTVLFGAMFPVFLNQERRESQPVSRVYAFNTIGGIFGSLLAGFGILPHFGIDVSLRLLVAVNMVLALVLIHSLKEPLRQRAITQSAIIVCFIAVAALIPRVDTLSLSRGVFMLLNSETRYQAISNQENRRILFQREGLNGSVTVIANENGMGDLSLRVSSKPVAETGEAGRRHLLMLGHLPMMFASSHSDVAVIGYGTGITTGSVLNYPGVERVDVLELEKQVLAASEFFSVKNGQPLGNPKTRVHAEDGRIFLTYTENKYDVITSDPISPWVAGAASLYSKDFYHQISQRLKRGGVFCQWLQMGDYASQTYRGVIATIHRSFGHVAIFHYGHDSVILASDAPLALPWQALEANFEHPPIADELASNGIRTPFEVLNFFIAGPEQVGRYVESTADLNSDDSVWLEYQMAKDLVSRREKAVIAQIIGDLLPGRTSAVLRAFPGAPIELTAEYLLRHPPIFLDEVHPYVFEDVVRSIDRDLPFGEWFRERETQDGTEQRYGLLWKSAQADFQNGDLASAQPKLEQLLDEVILSNYYQIGLEYIRVTAHLGQVEQALKTARRLQQMSPALPHAYQAEIQLRKAHGAELEDIVKRASTYNPDFRY